MRRRTAVAHPAAFRLAGHGSPRLLVTVSCVATLATLATLVLIKSNAGAASDAEPAPVPAVVATALTEAATSCPTLTPVRLAGQVMATTGFVATPEGGIGGLTAAQWKTWKPAPDALPDNARASLTALAHLTCDMIGQVRTTGISGDSWRLAVAALRSSLTDLDAARGVPTTVAPFVATVEWYAAWYTQHLTLPTQSPAPAASVSPTGPSATPRADVTAPPTRASSPAAYPPTAGTTAAPPSAIRFPNFSSATGLRLNGSAQVAGGQLHLTTGLQQAGSAWAVTTIDTTRSFTSAFIALVNGPTDGIAFVIQSEGPAALGGSGSGIGYGTQPGGNPADQIKPSIAVELDTWDNSSEGFDPAGHQHIAVTTGGDVTRHLAWQDPGFDLFANQPVYVFLTYDATAHRLQVYATPAPSQPSNPLLSLPVNLPTLLGTRAHVGFTGATGLTTLTDSSESVLSWSTTVD
jgi:Legume lectin domain